MHFTLKTAGVGPT